MKRSSRAEVPVAWPVARLGDGHPWGVPQGAEPTSKVLGAFSAVEATSPPAQVHGRDAFWQAKEDGAPYPRPDAYEDIAMPGNSAVGPIIGLAGAGAAFGLVWHIWWLAILGLLVSLAAVIARSFVRNTHRTLPTTAAAATEARWHAAIDAATPASRHLETQPANRGLAAVMPA